MKWFHKKSFFTNDGFPNPTQMGMGWDIFWVWYGMVGWWWSGDLCGDKRQYSDGISVDVESLIAINHHSESSRPNNDKQRSCYRGFSYSPRKIDYEMMVFEGFDDKKHGICTRRLTPWLKRVLWVPGGVLIPTESQRTPISACAHLQLRGTLVP